MEGLARTSEADDQEKKGKKKKDAAGLSRLPFARIDEREIATDTKEKPGKFDGLLAGLAIGSGERGKEDKPAGKLSKKEAKQRAREESGAAETTKPTTVEAVESDKADVHKQEQEPAQELSPDQLGGGEVVIDLRGPVEKRVIPLAVAAVQEQLPSEPHESEGWQRQPEQQHQTRAEEPAAPDLPPGGGGEVPPTEPPEAPAAPAEEPPEPSRSSRRARAERIEPAEAYRQYLLREAAARRDAEEVATRRDVQRAARRASSGWNQLWVGLAGLNVAEYFRHRRHERRAEKRAQTMERRMSTVQNKYESGLREQGRQQAAAAERFDAASRHMEEAAKRYEEQARRAEQAAAEAEQQRQAPPEHRLQSSAWHTIEVDTKTGKAVEQPMRFQYGEEYHRERAQEAVAAQLRDAAAGGAALAGVAGPSQTPQQDFIPGGVPAGLPNASMQGRPGDQPSADSSQDNRRPAPIWPWVVALAVVFITLIVVAT